MFSNGVNTQVKGPQKCRSIDLLPPKRAYFRVRLNRRSEAEEETSSWVLWLMALRKLLHVVDRRRWESASRMFAAAKTKKSQ